ncbi:hypothetical protein HOG98_08170 [bacterium]|jgi:hypothetical protein|nr:hypothetical protein [bacterium]
MKNYNHKIISININARHLWQNTPTLKRKDVMPADEPPINNKKRRHSLGDESELTASNKRLTSSKIIPNKNITLTTTIETSSDGSSTLVKTLTKHLPSGSSLSGTWGTLSCGSTGFIGPVTLTYPCGTKLCGHYKPRSEMSAGFFGQVTQTFPSGETLSGNWEQRSNGTLGFIGEATLHLPDNTSKIGHLEAQQNKSLIFVENATKKPIGIDALDDLLNHLSL